MCFSTLLSSAFFVNVSFAPLKEIFMSCKRDKNISSISVHIYIHPMCFYLDFIINITKNPKYIAVNHINLNILLEKMYKCIYFLKLLDLSTLFNYNTAITSIVLKKILI